MTKKPKPEAETPPTCGQCRHWRNAEADVAQCYFNPPQMEFDDEGACFLIRPILERTEIACERFTGAN